MRLAGRLFGHNTERSLHDPEPQPFWSRFAHIGLLLLLVLASLVLTTTAGAVALSRARLGVLETETASQLQADYSADARDIRVAPLDPQIISMAADDERNLAAATSEAPLRVEVAHQPTATPELPEPTPTAEPSGPPASDPFVSPSPTARPFFVVPSPTSAPTDVPTDTPTHTPTDTPTDTPTSTPTNTPTDTPTHTPTDTPTQTPLTPTQTPTDTPSATPLPPTASMTATVAATTTPTALPVPAVSIDPASQTTSDATVSIEVLVADATDLGGYEFTLTWDASLLTFSSISNEAFLGSTGRTVVCSAPRLDVVAVALDSITFGCSTTGDGPGPSGRGVLTALKFGATAAGRSELTFTRVTLSDTAGLPVAPTTANGAITVVSPTATDTPRSTETPTATALPATPTASATATTAATATSTLTPAPTATATAVPSSTATATATTTGTAIATPTFTATATGTASPTTTPTATPLPNVFIDPASQTTSSDTVSLDVRVAEVAALGNYTIALTWDPSVLSFTSVTNGPFLGSTGRTVACLPPTTTTASFTFGCSSTGGFGGASGTGILATVRFATVADGSSPLVLSASLSDTSSSPIPATSADGAVTFVAPTATATSTATPVPTVTNSPTATATSTATSTPTLTSTPTATSTATSMPTLTSTPTATATSTATSTATFTATPTPTATTIVTSTVTPTPEPQAKVAVNPPAQTVSAGGSIDIRVSSVTDLGAYGFELTYDPAVVAFVSVTNGSFLGSTGRTITCAGPVVTATSVAFGCDSTGSQPGPLGAGTLATVVFGAVAEGTSDLTLSSFLLDDTGGVAIPITVDDGQITIIAPASTPAATAVLTVTPTPTPIP